MCFYVFKIESICRYVLQKVKIAVVSIKFNVTKIILFFDNTNKQRIKNVKFGLSSDGRKPELFISVFF